MGQGQKVRQFTPQEIADLHEADKQWRMDWWPPQVDEHGKVRLCVQCHNPLHPLENRDYLATVGGYCNKLCRRAHEKKLMFDEGMTSQEASDEIDKVAVFKPITEIPVGV